MAYCYRGRAQLFDHQIPSIIEGMRWKRSRVFGLVECKRSSWPVIRTIPTANQGYPAKLNRRVSRMVCFFIFSLCMALPSYGVIRRGTTPSLFRSSVCVRVLEMNWLVNALQLSGITLWSRSSTCACVQNGTLHVYA